MEVPANLATMKKIVKTTGLLDVNLFTSLPSELVGRRGGGI